MPERDQSLESRLTDILRAYRDSLSDKVYGEENDDLDVLMRVFGITPSQKRENRQYWGRELGMCWQLLVTGVLSHHCKDFSPPMKMGADEPCDCVVGRDAIDTKYRIGSGDAGTLKKFRANGTLLRDMGYTPHLVIVRDDNLPAALRACESGGWTILRSDASFDYIKSRAGYDLKAFLERTATEGSFFVRRT